MKGFLVDRNRCGFGDCGGSPIGDSDSSAGALYCPCHDNRTDCRPRGHPAWYAGGACRGEVVGGGGFVVHGMHVDVIISDLAGHARTVWQNIEVPSAGPESHQNAVKQVVTVLLTPEQTEQLSRASRPATIQLA